MQVIHLVRSPSTAPSNTPLWFNDNGHKITPQSLNMFTPVDVDLLFGKGVTSYVGIKQVGKRPKYLVAWYLAHTGGLDSPQTTGRIECDPRELRKMFCLDDTMEDPDSNWLIHRYGGTTAVQGKFLRWGQYLTISGPGTGQNGDANISVFVSERIRDEVAIMLTRHGMRDWNRVTL